MRDAIAAQRVAKLHPSIREEVAELITAAEAKLGPYACIRVVQGLRTIAEQDALYAKGRTAPGPKVTNARGGQSIHNYGLAIDFAILYDKDKNGTFETLSWDQVADLDRDGLSDWKEVVGVFTAAGYDWGGNWVSFKDNPHLEKRGYKWRDLLARLNAGKMLEEYVDLG